LLGFTLIEILIAFIIMAVATTGLFASFVAAKKYVSRSRHRLAAVNAARMILEDLRAYVDQSRWTDSSNLLTCPGGGSCLGNYNLPADYPVGTPWNWSANYTSIPVNVSTAQMRRVTVNIHWDEPN